MGVAYKGQVGGREWGGGGRWWGYVGNLKEEIEMAIGSSLVPNQFWLVFLSGPTSPAMHQGSFIGSAKAICESRPGYL